MENSKIKPDMHAFMRELLEEIIDEKGISEESLHKWFKRKGAPGKKGGWVDCNAPKYKDGKKVGYKSCGRQKGEKRKYPACRPTPARCKDKGKGKSWGKKSKVTKEQLHTLVREVLAEKKKKKKKKKVKRDACYYKVKSRYDVWPSAFGSGQLVQCREKGAKNWGNKTKK
jgi:hypothetical protein